jgi:solute carrier family 8 (sodium/calcium exchanger)
VYIFWTPNKVTLAEALLTLLWQPFLVLLVYLVDNHPWSRHSCSVEEAGHMVNGNEQQEPTKVKESLQHGYAWLCF